MEHFQNIVDYNFTATLEKDFDEIADGKKKWNDPIAKFYKNFDPQVQKIDKTTGKYHGERLLGVDPDSGKNVYSKLGPYGPMVQIGESTDEEKPKFAGLLYGQTIENITLEQALDLFKFPKKIGESEGKELVVSVGRFGPYVRFDGKFYSIPKDINPIHVDLKKALEIIANKKEKDKNSILKTFAEEPELFILKGRFGPYIKFEGKNYPLGSKKKYDEISIEEIKEIIEENLAKSSKKKVAAKEKTVEKEKADTKKTTKSTTKKSAAKKETTKKTTTKKTTKK